MRRALLLLLFTWSVALGGPVPAQDAAAAPGGVQGPVQEGGASDQDEPTEQAPIVLEFTVVRGASFDPNRLRDTLGVRIGTPLDDAHLERIARGIETLWAAGVRADVEYTRSDLGIALRVAITETALDLSPRFVGNERIDEDEVLEWAGLRRGDDVRLSQSVAVARRLEERYRQEGYHFATARAVRGEYVPGEGGAAPTQDLIFEIDEGPRVRVRGLRYVGNDSLPNAGWGPWASGLRHEASPKLRKPILGWIFGSLFAVPFREDRLREDLVAMRQAYRDLGYLDAVVQLDRLEFSRDNSWVTIHVLVDEGEPFVVTSVRVIGFRRVRDASVPGGWREVPTELIVPEDELLALCKLAPGDVLTRYEVEVDSRAFARRYGEIGHLAHNSLPGDQQFEVLEPDYVFAAEGNSVAVTYRLAQGTEQRLREIRFTGNLRTRDSVLRRELGDVFEGEIADLVRIERGMARLRGTGFFSSVSRLVDHRDPTYRFREVPGEPGWKDLEIQVEEGDQIRFDFGVVYGTDNGLAGQIGVTFQNFDITRWPSWQHPFDDIGSGRAFRGAGQTLRVFASPGTDFSRYQLLFSEPDLFGRHLDRIGATVDLSRGFRGYRTHEERRDSLGLALFKQLDADSRLSFGLRTTAIRIDDVVTGAASIFDPLAVPDLLADQLGDTRVTGLELEFSRAVVDNVLAPREGFTTSASIGVFDGVFGSDFDYVSLDASYDLYGSFVDDPDVVKPGYRLRLRGAVLAPYGDTDAVPFSERLFLGGSRLMRGFDFRGIGPNQRGHSQGGESMLVASAEYLWPLVTQSLPGTARRTEVFRGGFFVDVGLLDPEAFQLDFDEFRVSAGWTVGMVAPLPIALNFGFPIVKGDGDRRRTFSFTISY